MSGDKIAFYKEAWAELAKCSQSSRDEAFTRYIPVDHPDVQELVQHQPAAFGVTSSPANIKEGIPYGKFR